MLRARAHARLADCISKRRSVLRLVSSATPLSHPLGLRRPRVGNQINEGHDTSHEINALFGRRGIRSVCSIAIQECLEHEERRHEVLVGCPLVATWLSGKQNVRRPQQRA